MFFMFFTPAETLNLSIKDRDCVKVGLVRLLIELSDF